MAPVEEYRTHERPLAGRLRHCRISDLGINSDQSPFPRVVTMTMKALAGGLLVVLAGSAPLAAQERERSLERIAVALQQPAAIVRGIDPDGSATPKTFGIFTLIPPEGRGEMVRVSVPVGELVSRVFKGVAATRHRRQEAAARRQVDVALKWLADQQGVLPPMKR